ncbi:helix-turn-helix transcriptional regulator [Paenibacillus hamazuiensis]|uniref:helix-turn-helix transcriptional regulator n=1 Tax=Paenibacillus hamazuiensis TaxID=2936508 RepID=UPI00200DD525|nr:AraC family transcriptional regulator [Paenibacillus hamazuiensis]
MNELIGKKYHIGDSAFSIQQMRRFGFSAMPRPHSHSFYELYYLLRGERVYFMNGKVYTAQKGDMVIVIPNDLHSTASSQVEEFERVLVHVTPEFLPAEDRSILQLPPFRESTLLRAPLKEQAEIEHLLLQMLAECREEQPFYPSYVRQLVLKLLIRLHRMNAHIPKSAHSDHPMHQKVSDITAYIHEHYREPLTLEQLAKIFFISPAYLSRVFLKLTGFHLGEYIRVVRIREAQKMLRSSREKVHLIAEQVGFEHISHFNKTFKKLTGFSPLHYRKQHKDRG